MVQVLEVCWQGQGVGGGVSSSGARGGLTNGRQRWVSARRLQTGRVRCLAACRAARPPAPPPPLSAALAQGGVHSCVVDMAWHPRHLPMQLLVLDVKGAICIWTKVRRLCVGGGGASVRHSRGQQGRCRRRRGCAGRRSAAPHAHTPHPPPRLPACLPACLPAPPFQALAENWSAFAPGFEELDVRTPMRALGASASLSELTTGLRASLPSTPHTPLTARAGEPRLRRA